jgi:hypothetical protein
MTTKKKQKKERKMKNESNKLGKTSSTATEIVLGAINKSTSSVENAFNNIIRPKVLDAIETKRAEMGSNILQQARASADD